MQVGQVYNFGFYKLNYVRCAGIYLWVICLEPRKLERCITLGFVVETLSIVKLFENFRLSSNIVIFMTNAKKTVTILIQGHLCISHPERKLILSRATTNLSH